MEGKINVSLTRFDVLHLLTKGISPNHYLMEKYINLGLGTFNVNYGGWKWTKTDGKNSEVWDNFDTQSLFEMYVECRDSWLIPHTY